MPNSPQKNKLASYSLSVDDLERLINIDLYCSLEDRVEELTESTVNLKFWGL